MKNRISRRTILKAGAAGFAGLAAPAIIRPAHAAGDTIRIMGVETAALDDWSAFEAETGLKVEYEGIGSDPGIFRQQIVANEIGERVDIVLMDGGIEDDLGEKGFFQEIDAGAIPSWSKASPDIVGSPLAQGPSGKQFGLPVVMNADSFVYAVDEIGEDEPLSYALLFESDKTMGKVALENGWLTTFPMAAIYMNGTGRTQIAEPSNMTPDEARQVSDFLIERKRAGQFRAFWSTWEESIDLVASREVIVENCWEPAVLELQRKGLNVRYATTVEGYNKWMICAYVPAQVSQRGSVDVVNRALEGFLGGAYASQIALLRGYSTANPAAALDYAEANDLSAQDIENIKANIEKVETKFKAAQFWQNAAPEHVQAIEAEFERFRLA